MTTAAFYGRKSTEQTGVAASTFKGGEQGAIARVKLQNAQGGVNTKQQKVVIQ